ncbi:hypothetical protein GUJ93_ZPchr0002g24172 [Zizania palustris]|uniref:Uncharacterized protein n=1 Tax=Zizania palustris TaxID=103762 RepID=A0A8J5RH49_ZIZPA|nr:hypothetical protein GUJ93_ZPchr0002g24172 [Zizania palustris]
MAAWRGVALRASVHVRHGVRRHHRLFDAHTRTPYRQIGAERMALQSAWMDQRTNKSRRDRARMHADRRGLRRARAVSCLLGVFRVNLTWRDAGQVDSWVPSAGPDPDPHVAAAFAPRTDAAFAERERNMNHGWLGCAHAAPCGPPGRAPAPAPAPARESCA